MHGVDAFRLEDGRLRAVATHKSPVGLGAAAIYNEPSLTVCFHIAGKCKHFFGEGGNKMGENALEEDFEDFVITLFRYNVISL